MPCGDIADGRRDQLVTILFDGAEADLHREFTAIGALAEQLQADTHGPNTHIADVAVAMRLVAMAKPLRKQGFHGLAEDAGHVVAEQRRHLPVGEHDAPARIDDDHCVGRGIENTSHEFG